MKGGGGEKVAAVYLVGTILTNVSGPALTVFRVLNDVLGDEFIGVQPTASRNTTNLVSVAKIDGQVLIVAAHLRRPR